MQFWQFLNFKSIHLSAHTTSELPACSKQAQNTAQSIARMRIAKEMDIIEKMKKAVFGP